MATWPPLLTWPRLTLPANALRLTFPVVEITDSLVVPATPALVMLKACAACTSTEPLPVTVISPAEPIVTSPAVASKPTEPPAVLKAAVNVSAVPCSNRLPTVVLPVSVTAWVTLRAPAAVITTEPLAALTPDWAASVVGVVAKAPLACTRFKLTATVVPTSSALASARANTPSAVVALIFKTSLSRGLAVEPNTPTPAPAVSRKPAAYTSVAALLSPSSTEPPAFTLTEPQLACPVKATAVRSAALRVSTRPKVTFLAAAEVIKRTLAALV